MKKIKRSSSISHTSTHAHISWWLTRTKSLYIVTVNCHNALAQLKNQIVENSCAFLFRWRRSMTKKLVLEAVRLWTSEKRPWGANSKQSFGSYKLWYWQKLKSTKKTLPRFLSLPFSLLLTSRQTIDSNTFCLLNWLVGRFDDGDTPFDK